MEEGYAGPQLGTGIAVLRPLQKGAPVPIEPQREIGHGQIMEELFVAP